MGIDALLEQYEAYPYPARNPMDERRRLITGSPSHLDELNHYIFGGRLRGGCRPDGKPLRILVAGGGTGDGTIQLAQQLSDSGAAATVCYLDLSVASRRVAEERAKVRGLNNIAFHTGSLLDLATPDGGPVSGTFDYIDCCGVLHHLPEPAAGLRALKGRLNPQGGIGIMVYAPYGRTGVYPMQDALRALTAGLPIAEKVALAKRLLKSLPKSNWLLNNPFISDHRSADADLYDLLLHSSDRAYTVSELAALAETAGLAISALIEPAAYDPAHWIKDPRVLKSIQDMDFIGRAALAEQVCGSITKHIAYLVRPAIAADAVAAVGSPDETIPVLRDVDGPLLARGLPPSRILEADLIGQTLSLALPPLAGPILARVNGIASLEEIYQDINGEQGGKIDWQRFRGQFETLFQALNSIGKMYLRLQPRALVSTKAPK